MNNQPDINPASSASRDRKFKRAFSLIELLVVIAIIAVIAAILLPVGNRVALKARIQTAQSEMNQVETAIDAYHAKFGFYPPCNGNTNIMAALTNQLYYELVGTTTNFNNGVTNFVSLDQSSTLPAATVQEYFSIGGIMNCTKGVGEDAVKAQTFAGGLKPGQVATNIDGVYVLTTSAASDGIYRPMQSYSTLSGRPANPWRYLYPGINNPNSYDLWVQVFVGGKTNLICNWKDTPQINSPLP
jgi:prepilin-type N-terminal cleavage/methylation domain-containing protein